MGFKLLQTYIYNLIGNITIWFERFLSKFSIALIAAFILLNPNISCAQNIETGPISAKAFVDVPDSFDAAISPDGTEVAILQSSWESVAVRDWDKIIIRGTTANSTNRLSLKREDRMVHWIVWPKKDRLIAHILSVTYQRRSYTLFDQIIAIDTNNGAEKVLKSVTIRRLQSSYKPARIVSFGKPDTPEVYMSIADGKNNDLLSINVYTGASRIVERGNKDTVDWEVDRDGTPELRIDIDYDTVVSRYFARSQNGKNWEQIAQILPSQNMEFEVVTTSEESGKLYVIGRPENAERRGLYLYNLANQAYERKIYEHEKYDISGAYVVGRPSKYIGSYYFDHTLEYDFVEDEMKKAADTIQDVVGKDQSWQIFDSDESGERWLLYSEGPKDSGTYWFHDNSKNLTTKIIAAREDLPANILSNVEVIDWAAQDGTKLSGYVTKPRIDAQISPLIVMPHGGPELRDTLSFNQWAQFFASNGYIVFQPNFRGSDGYGKSFAQAGWHQWGAKMRTDIEDGVDKLLLGGKIDKSNMFFVGASYGGYAAMNAATEPNSRYSCFASISGISDLNEFIKFQEARKPFIGKDDLVTFWKNRIGDPAVDLPRIDQASPIKNINNLNSPLYLVHGKLDEIVPPDQSIKMEAAAKSAGKQVELYLLDFEGHSNWEEENEVSVLSNVAYFLTKCKIANETKAGQAKAALNGN